MEIFKIERNCTEIHYEYLKSTIKTEETVVLLHGNGLNSGSWYKIIDDLRERYHVLMYDFPGEGKSPLKATLPSWSELSEDLKLLLDFLQIEKCHLIGHGAGGNLSIYFTNEYPQYVKSVTLISTPCYFSKALYKKYIEFRKDLVSKGGFNNLIDYMVPRITISPKGSHDWNLIWESYNITSLEMHFHFYHLVVDVNWINMVARIEQPVLLLSGALDPILSAYSSAITSSFIPRSHYINIPSASNMVFIDNPKETVVAFNDFVQKSNDSINFDPFLIEYHSHIRQELSQVLLEENDETNSRLKIEVLDKFSVSINGSTIDKGWNRRNAKNLLLYFAVHRKVSRERVLEIFWPDIDPVKARNHLRVSLSNLRKIFEGYGVKDLLVTDREYIALNGTVECDLLELLNKLKDNNVTKKSLEKYADIILSENYLSGFYDNWSVSIKQFITNMFELHYPELYDGG